MNYSLQVSSSPYLHHLSLHSYGSYASKGALCISANAFPASPITSKKASAPSRSKPSSTKASPTLSLSTASVCSRTSSLLPDAHNSIPFPSSARIDRAPGVDIDLDISSFVVMGQPQTTPGYVKPKGELEVHLHHRPPPPLSLSVPWNMDLRRRRRTKQASSLPSADLPRRSSGKDKVASNGTTTLKLSKRPGKRSRKQNTDLQFTVNMHRTLAKQLWSALSLRQGKEADVLLEQENLLVERLWRSLVDQGFKPILSPRPLLLPAVSTPAGTGNQHEGIAMAPSLSFKDLVSTPQSSPQTVPSHSHRSSMSSSDISSMPRLVAALLLRYNDRQTTRPRKASSSPRPIRPPSRLSEVLCCAE